jgi:predicted nucleic-acid-binding Zn-ribbon protein
MKLTRSQTKMLLDNLDQKWKHPQDCPICHSIEWKIPQSLLELREYEEGDIIAYPKDSAIIPLVAVTCINCGYTLLFNAITAGILDDNLIGGEENE